MLRAIRIYVATFGYYKCELPSWLSGGYRFRSRILALIEKGSFTPILH
jgi:hypothetical protein